jgi:hypothetical protein
MHIPEVGLCSLLLRFCARQFAKPTEVPTMVAVAVALLVFLTRKPLKSCGKRPVDDVEVGDRMLELNSSSSSSSSSSCSSSSNITLAIFQFSLSLLF